MEAALATHMAGAIQELLQVSGKSAMLSRMEHYARHAQILG